MATFGWTCSMQTVQQNFKKRWTFERAVSNFQYTRDGVLVRQSPTIGVLDQFILASSNKKVWYLVHYPRIICPLKKWYMYRTMPQHIYRSYLENDDYTTVWHYGSWVGRGTQEGHQWNYQLITQATLIVHRATKILGPLLSKNTGQRRIK